MSESVEPCLVCGKETNIVCGNCGERYYCGEECQKADWMYHVGECRTGEIGAFWGIGKWKSIVNEHLEVVLAKVDEIIHPKESNLPHIAGDTDITSNARRWTKGKSTDTTKLQNNLQSFNGNILDYATSTKNEDPSGKNRHSDGIKSSAKDLAKFFKTRDSFGTVWSSDSDFDSAWQSYAACFISYIVSLYRDKKRNMNEYYVCKRAANSLGAVLNGRPWR